MPKFPNIDNACLNTEHMLVNFKWYTLWASAHIYGSHFSQIVHTQEAMFTGGWLTLGGTSKLLLEKL